MKYFIAFLLSLSFTAQAQTYICGNEYKALCRYSFDEYGFHQDQRIDNNCWFVKTNLLPKFFKKKLTRGEYVLITSNADHGVEEQFRKHLDHTDLIHWYGQNVEIRHPKVTSIPIGICNFADHDKLRLVQGKDLPKTKIVYANYAVSTNPKEREKCLQATRIPLEPRKEFEEFLEDIARSYFVISPNGNGIDCHRTWEALYLKAIPIVTRSINSEYYADLPIIILDSWDDFQDLELTPELYAEIWGDFDPSVLTVEFFIPEHHR